MFAKPYWVNVESWSEVTECSCACDTDIAWRSQNLGHLDPGMGSNGDICYVWSVGMYYIVGVKINMREPPHGAQRLLMQFSCVCFRMCGRQKPNIPNWSSMGDEAITLGDIG